MLDLILSECMRMTEVGLYQETSLLDKTLSKIRTVCKYHIKASKLDQTYTNMYLNQKIKKHNEKRWATSLSPHNLLINYQPSIHWLSKCFEFHRRLQESLQKTPFEFEQSFKIQVCNNLQYSGQSPIYVVTNMLKIEGKGRVKIWNPHA